MTDMRASLTLRARSTGTKEIDAQANAVEKVGKSATVSGERIKKALRWQNGAWQEVKQSTSEATAEVKRLGGTMEATAAKGRQTTETVKRGLQDGTREWRRTTTEVERAGRGLERLRSAASRGIAGMRTVATTARREFEGLRQVLGGVGERLALLGIGVGAAHVLKSSAALDPVGLRIGQRSGMSPEQRAQVRHNAWTLARDSGLDVGHVLEAREILGNAGLSDKAAGNSWSIATQMASVTGASPDVIAQLGANASDNFDMSLERAGAPEKLFSALYASQRFGHANSEVLRGVFQYGASTAGLARWDLPTFLGMTQALSPTRAGDPGGSSLGTLMKQLMDPWATPRAMAQISRGSGVKFLDAKKQFRDPLDILQDLGKRMEGFKDDKDRLKWLNKVFGRGGGIDKETQAALMFAIKPETIAKARETREATKHEMVDPTVLHAAYQEKRTLPETEAGRVRATIGEALDKAAEPINRALAEGVQHLLDDKGLSGGELLAGAAGTGIAAYVSSRLAKWGGNKAMAGLMNLVGGSADTMKNIVVGHALQEATGVMPVFVTNWSDGQGSVEGIPSAGKGIGSGAKAGLLALPMLAFGGAMVEMTFGKIQSEVFDTLHDPKGLDKSLQGKMHRGPTRWANVRWRSPEPVAPPTAEQNARAARLADAMSDVAGSGVARALVPGLADSVGEWSQRTAAKLDPGSHSTPAEQMQQAAAVLDAARKALESLLGKPLQIEVTSDTPEIHARLNERHARDARRG